MSFVFPSQYKFIIKISESRILKSQSSNINISYKPNYLIEETPTESIAGGVLINIFIKHALTLWFTNAKKRKFIFIKVILPEKSSLIIRCIYRHPYIDICTFNDHQHNPLLSKEANKINGILGDFNIDLLSFDTSDHINIFFDVLASYSLQLQIVLPTGVCKNSKIEPISQNCDLWEHFILYIRSSSTTFHTTRFFFQLYSN